jgi:hypothetical protein
LLALLVTDGTADLPRTGSPRLAHFAEITASPAELKPVRSEEGGLG